MLATDYSDTLLQQVNRNCFALTLTPSNDVNAIGNFLFLFGGDYGAVESNKDLVAFYNFIYGNVVARNWFNILNFRMGAGVVAEQRGTFLFPGKSFSRYLMQRKLRVVKTVLQGKYFANANFNGSDKSYESYPFDVWQTNGIGTLQKTMSLNLKKFFVPDPAITSRNRTIYQSDEIYEFDNKTVIATPALLPGIAPIPLNPPAIQNPANPVSNQYYYANWIQCQLFFQDEMFLRNPKKEMQNFRDAMNDDRLIIDPVLDLPQQDQITYFRNQILKK